MINTLLRFEVIGKCLDGSFILVISFSRFWYGKSFENIAGLLSDIMQWHGFLLGCSGNAHCCEHIIEMLNILPENN